MPNEPPTLSELDRMVDSRNKCDCKTCIGLRALLADLRACREALAKIAAPDLPDPQGIRHVARETIAGLGVRA